MYWLDRWLKKRFAISLLFLFIFRWLARGYGQPTASLGNPFVWPVGILLFLAFALLQWSKLREPSA